MDGVKLGGGGKAVYALGTLGKEVSYGMINTYCMLYLTVFMGLNGIAVGFCFCFVRLLTAIADPIMATLVNNTKSKLGKFRPWILAGTILNAICLIVLFLPINGGTGLKYFYYLFVYLLWGITYTMIEVPFMSMVPSIADTTAERESVSSLSRLVGGFGGFVIGSGGSVIIGLTYGMENTKSYFIVAAVGSIILFAMMALVTVSLKERYKLPCLEIKFKQIFKLFKENDQVRAFTGSYLFFSIGASIALFQIVYLFIYDTGHLDFSKHFIIFNVVACTGQGIAMMFYTLITKKLSREKVFGLTYILAFIGLIAMFFVSYLFGNNKLLNVILFSFAASFMMIANGVNQISSMVMITDVVDYGEFKTGVRSDSIMISVQTLLLKVSGALAMLVLGIGVFISGLPTINLLTNTFSGEVTDKMLTILRAFMFLAPLPLMPVGYIYYKKKYKLYGDYYKSVKATIDAVRVDKTDAAARDADADNIN